MNRIITGFTVAAVSLLAVSACRKEQVFQEGGLFEITAGLAQSKTYNDGLSTNWSKDDKLCVKHAPSGGSYIMDGCFTHKTDNVFKGDLAASLEEGIEYDWRALFPYDAGMKGDFSDVVIQIGGYQVQSGYNNTAHLAGNGFPVFGAAQTTGSSSPSFSMKNLCAIVEMTVKNESGFDTDITGLDFTLPSGKYTRGKFQIDYTSSETPVITYSREGANTTHLEIKNPTSLENGKTAKFYLGIAPAQVSSGSTVKLSVNGVEKSIILDKDTDFQSGHIKKASISYYGNPGTIYIVDNDSLVLSLKKISPTKYRTTSIGETRKLGSSFRIAEKVADGAIDPSGFVIGGSDYRNLSYIKPDGTAIKKPDVYGVTNISMPDAIEVDIETMSLNFVTVLDYNTMGDATDYKVRWVCTMPQNSIVEFKGFPKPLSSMLQPDRFDCIDDISCSARFIGVDTNYEVYYIKSTGWLNFWQFGAAPNSMLLIGKNASMPLAPYTTGGYKLSETGFCQNPWSTVYMCRTEADKFVAMLYLDDDFAFYFYTDRAWAKCFSGWTSGTPETLTVKNPASGYPYGVQNTSKSFVPGVYTLELNTTTKVASLRKGTSYSAINGTTILAGNKIIGLVADEQTGKGIQGVPVTDGYTYTTTDANGVYQMAGNALCRKVYYSLPSGYETILDDKHCPVFFSTKTIDMSSVNRNDFVLRKKSGDDRNFSIVAVADPQTPTTATVERFRKEMIADIMSTVNNLQEKGALPNVYGVGLGDLACARDIFSEIKSTMCDLKLASGKYLPFYQAPGNHDHIAGTNDYESLADFVKYFGPNDFSFNVGKAHIVVMDDIIVDYLKDSYNWHYSCGFTDSQYTWLQQDLATVANQGDKLLIVCLHAPFGNAPGIANYISKENKYTEVLNLFKGFHDVHILSGHTHYSMNVILKDFKAASGRAFYDHNHTAACGMGWTEGNVLSSDGSPVAYYMYEIHGNEMYDWNFKAVNRDSDYQLRVYDGNQIYTGAGGSSFCWYDTSKTPTKYHYCVNSLFKDSFVVTLWNGDPENWKVELFVNGLKVGDLVMADGGDISYNSFVLSDPWDFTGANLKYCQHYWYIKAPNLNPSTMTNWEIRATFKMPTSSVTHVYSSNTLQKDYTGYDKF